MKNKRQRKKLQETTEDKKPFFNKNKVNIEKGFFSNSNAHLNPANEKLAGTNQFFQNRLIRKEDLTAVNKQAEEEEVQSKLQKQEEEERRRLKEEAERRRREAHDLPY